MPKMIKPISRRVGAGTPRRTPLEQARMKFEQAKENNGTLDLDNMDLTDDDLVEITKWLRQDPFGDEYRIRTISLRNNKITTLKTGMFKNLRVSGGIDFRGNKITTVEPLAFEGLVADGYVVKETRHIPGRYDGSEFRQHPDRTVIETLDSAVGTIRLDGCELTSVSRQAFANIKEVQRLYLSGNKIRTVEPMAFQNSLIKQLKLDDNQIQVLETDAFKDMTVRFENVGGDIDGSGDIDLSRNQIKTIQSGAFAGIKPSGLRTMNSVPLRARNVLLNDNELESVNAGMFAGLDIGGNLDLSNNQITKITLSDFASAKNCPKVLLRNNNIFEVVAGPHDQLPKGIQLDLRRNYLNGERFDRMLDELKRDSGGSWPKKNIDFDARNQLQKGPSLLDLLEPEAQRNFFDIKDNIYSSGGLTWSSNTKRYVNVRRFLQKIEKIPYFQGEKVRNEILVPTLNHLLSGTVAEMNEKLTKAMKWLGDEVALAQELTKECVKIKGITGEGVERWMAERCAIVDLLNERNNYLRADSEALANELFGHNRRLIKDEIKPSLLQYYLPSASSARKIVRSDGAIFRNFAKNVCKTNPMGGFKLFGGERSLFQKVLFFVPIEQFVRSEQKVNKITRNFLRQRGATDREIATTVAQLRGALFSLPKGVEEEPEPRVNLSPLVQRHLANPRITALIDVDNFQKDLESRFDDLNDWRKREQMCKEFLEQRLNRLQKELFALEKSVVDKRSSPLVSSVPFVSPEPELPSTSNAAVAAIQAAVGRADQKSQSSQSNALRLTNKRTKSPSECRVM